MYWCRYIRIVSNILSTSTVSLICLLDMKSKSLKDKQNCRQYLENFVKDFSFFLEWSDGERKLYKKVNVKQKLMDTYLGEFINIRRI